MSSYHAITELKQCQPLLSFSKKFHNVIGTIIVVSLDFAGWDQRNVEFCDLRDKLLLLSGGFKERVVIVVLVISLTATVIFCMYIRRAICLYKLLERKLTKL